MTSSYRQQQSSWWRSLKGQIALKTLRYIYWYLHIYMQNAAIVLKYRRSWLRNRNGISKPQLCHYVFNLWTVVCSAPAIILHNVAWTQIQHRLPFIENTVIFQTVFFKIHDIHCNVTIPKYHEYFINRCVTDNCICGIRGKQYHLLTQALPATSWLGIFWELDSLNHWVQSSDISRSHAFSPSSLRLVRRLSKNRRHRTCSALRCI